jgi:hypothetical protein
MILQLASVHCVRIKGISFDCLVDLFFLMEKIQNESPLNSFSAKFELNQMKFHMAYFASTGWQNDVAIQQS